MAERGARGALEVRHRRRVDELLGVELPQGEKRCAPALDAPVAVDEHAQPHPLDARRLRRRGQGRGAPPRPLEAEEAADAGD